MGSGHDPAGLSHPGIARDGLGRDTSSTVLHGNGIEPSRGLDGTIWTVKIPRRALIPRDFPYSKNPEESSGIARDFNTGKITREKTPDTDRSAPPLPLPLQIRLQAIAPPTSNRTRVVATTSENRAHRTTPCSPPAVAAKIDKATKRPLFRISLRWWRMTRRRQKRLLGLAP